MVKFLKKKKRDIFVLLLLPFFTILLSLAINATYLESIILFLGVPSLFLSFRAPYLIKKVLIFSIVFSLPLGFLVDYLVTVDGGWFVPFSYFSRVFGVVPVEDIIFGFLSSYLAVIFYEYFFDKGVNHLFENRLKKLLTLSVFLLVGFLFIYFVFPGLLVIPYAFMFICSIFLLTPVLAIIFIRPSLIGKYTYCLLYFLLISICFEPTALYLNQWYYLGAHYLGWLTISNFSFPLEEIVFFWFVYNPAILSWYEFFDDDGF